MDALVCTGNHYITQSTYKLREIYIINHLPLRIQNYCTRGGLKKKNSVSTYKYCMCIAQYGPLHKILTFWSALNFFGPKNGPRCRSCHLIGPKKSRAPQKVSILCKGPFRILEMAPFSDFQGLISKYPATFTAQWH